MELEEGSSTGGEDAEDRWWSWRQRTSILALLFFAQGKEDPTTCYFASLPKELIVNIISYLPVCQPRWGYFHHPNPPTVLNIPQAHHIAKITDNYIVVGIEGENAALFNATNQASKDKSYDVLIRVYRFNYLEANFTSVCEVSLTGITSRFSYLATQKLNNGSWYVLSGHMSGNVAVVKLKFKDDLNKNNYKYHNNLEVIGLELVQADSLHRLGCYGLELYNENCLVTTAADGEFAVWRNIHEKDSKSGIEVNSCQTPIYCMGINNKAQIAIFGTKDELKLWNLQTGSFEESLIGHTYMILVIFCYDKYVVSTDNDDEIRIWDIETRQCLRKMKGQKSSWSLYRLGDILISGEDYERVTVWNWRTGAEVVHWHAFSGSKVDEVLVLRDCVVTIGGSSIQIWYPQNKKS